MQEIKDSKQATVRIGYDGKVHKTFRGPSAKERYGNEIRVLKYLQEKGCPFVPRVLAQDDEKLYMVTTNCGSIVDKISQDRLRRLFTELEGYGVRHSDPYARNVTYNADLGRFCLIDFEFATILESGEGFSLEELEEMNRGDRRRAALEKLAAVEREAREDEKKERS